MAPLSITQSVGASGKNLLNEERAIQELLRKAGIPFRGPRTLAGDIDEFQRVCKLKTDGLIDPRGATLRNLNAVANPLKLTIKDSIVFGEGAGSSTVSSDAILNGGYQISYASDDGMKGDTKLPAAYRVTLGPEQANAVDVSERPMKDLLNAAKLAELLKLIDTRSAWGSSLNLKLFVTLDGALISTSTPAPLRCPVKPHNGKLLSADENKELFYLGDPDAKQFYGRMFQTIPGFDKQLFCWAGRFELDSSKRGFDCITFAGTTCGAAHTDMGGNGADLATALGATEITYDKVKLDTAKMDQLASYFEKNTSGYYLLYSSGHVTLVVDSNVYEFKPHQTENKGFVKTPVADWFKSHKDGWTLRKLAGKPPLANA